MVATPLKQESSSKLHGLFEALGASIAETLSSLVGRKIAVQGDVLQVQDAPSIARGLPRASVSARGEMGKDFDGKNIFTVFEVPDAIAMAGLLMMTPEDVIAQRRKDGAIEGEDAAAFGELGNVVYSGFTNVLEEQVDNIEIKMADHATIEPGVDTDLFGKARLVTFSFRMKVGEYPESTGVLAIDLATAQSWNGGPLESADDEVELDPQGDTSAAQRAEDDGLENIPEAPIRGVMSAFIVQSDAFKLLRRSCRRVGLELRRHGRGEIPNPAAHRNQIVVLDVLPGEDRRFDWCRRIKELSDTTKVVVLIHHPSRQRVTQAFLSRADAILGFPCEETQLSQKLGQLLEQMINAPEQPPTEG